MQTKKKRFISMLALILAGEAVFFLPFVLIRIFRPTVLEVFNLTNLELGIAQSVYGVIAMISYFFGGMIADKFQARKLIAFGLALTGLGGLFLANYPSFEKLKLLYGFWGFTTIFLFWAALIKATRLWGTSDTQGKAFGLLEGGRGFAAALMATFSVALFSFLTPSDFDSISFEGKQLAFQKIILYTSIFVFIISILAWFFIPRDSNSNSQVQNINSFKGLRNVFKMPVVWLQAIIIVCGYVAYKFTDDFSLFANEVLGFNDLESAKVATVMFWLRPISALAAGLIADKLSSSKMIIISFSIIIIGSSTIGLGYFNYNLIILYIILIAVVSIGVYALRSIYFSIMEEGNIPLKFTGTAVGLVSVIGYTPDIFASPLMGYILDRNPGEVGHRHLFIVMCGFAIVGLLTALLYRKFRTIKS